MTSKPRILLVDYRPQSIVATGRSLETAGYEVRVASDGAEAVRVYGELRPDLVLILEAMLPKKHGFQVCREIKEASHGKIPVILASAVHRGRRYRLEAVKDHGCDEYIERPASEEQILASVQRLVPPRPDAGSSGASDIEERVEELFGKGAHNGQEADTFRDLSRLDDEPLDVRDGAGMPATTLPSLDDELDRVFGAIEHDDRGTRVEQWLHAAASEAATPVASTATLELPDEALDDRRPLPESISEVESAFTHASGGLAQVPHAVGALHGAPAATTGFQRAILYLSAGIATVVIVVLGILLMQSAEPQPGSGATSPQVPPPSAAKPAPQADGTH